MSKADIVGAVVGIQAGIIVGLAVLVSKLREKVARLEEWARLYEKRLNGTRD